MVMGAIGGAASGTGTQGPPGPQGPPGVLGSDTALAVFARAVLPPPPALQPGLWTPLNFGVIEADTHQTIQTQPVWTWRAPLPGVYQLLSSILLDPLAGTPTFDLHVLHNGMEEVLQNFAGHSAQIGWTGQAKPGDILQVEIRLTGTIPAQISGGPPRSCVVVSGIGVTP